MTAQVNKLRRSNLPSATPPMAESGVRLSMRLLGLWLAVIPFVLGVWGGSQTVFQALKWPFAALGAALFMALVWRERCQATPSENGGIPLRTLIPGEPFLTGAAMIAIGLVLSSAFSPVPGLGLLTTLRESVFLILAVVLFVHRPRLVEVRWVLLCLLATVAAQSALAIAQGFFPAAMNTLTPGIGDRTGRAAMIGTLGNPEYLASWAAPAVAAAVVLLFSRAIQSRNKIVPAVACALGVAMIFLSGGRGAVLSLTVGLAATLFVLRPRDASSQTARRKKTPILVVAIALTLLGLVALASFLAYGMNQTGDRSQRGMLPQRIASTFDLHSASMRHRIGLYTITGRMITHAPLLGAGPGLFANAFARTQGTLARDERGIGIWSLNAILSGHYSGEAHCDPLQWWAEYGLLPFLGLTLMILRALTDTATRLKSGPSAWLAALWTALLVTFLTMWTSFPLHVPDRALTFWVLLGLLAGAMVTRTKAQE